MFVVCPVNLTTGIHVFIFYDIGQNFYAKIILASKKKRLTLVVHMYTRFVLPSHIKNGVLRSSD
jgi:hypothetical protein